VTLGAPLVVERRVSAPPSAVYAYLTVSDLWAKWQGVGATIDPRAGGLFRMEMGTGQVARGQFVELVVDRRVVFTWGWIDNSDIPPGSTVVEIDLVPEGEGTLIRLTHRDLPQSEVEMHQIGWVHYLGRLAICAVGIEPGPDPGPGG
jgi:uncharacterized protein YndB with AHSA1/START domain